MLIHCLAKRYSRLAASVACLLTTGLEAVFFSVINRITGSKYTV